MKIINAKYKDISAINHVVYSTINKVYPAYYSAGIIEFFLNIHSIENIEKDVISGSTYLMIIGKKIIGTFTIKENEFSRFFILPDYRGRGYGSIALTYIENIIFSDYSEIKIIASKPGYPVYLKRGYVVYKYVEERIVNDDIEGYHIMIKNKTQ